jgi:hypothetical protein
VARNDLRDDAYDPNEVYIGGSKDRDGHSTNIRAKIPDTWMGTIGEAIASPDWPEYRSPQVCYRDAIYPRMRWMARAPDRSSSPKVRALMALAHSEAAMDYANLIRDANQSLLERADDTLRKMVSDGNQLALRSAIKELEAGLDGMEEPWRSQLESKLSEYDRRSRGL